MHNFTFFDLKTKCFTSHEGESKLSANEFSSIICKFIEDRIPDKEEVTLWIDGCTYQNRNRTLADGILSVAMAKCNHLSEVPGSKAHKCSVILCTVLSKES